MYDLSLIIPAYNEGGNLEVLFKRLEPLANKNIEIIFVDNGSTDNTRELFQLQSEKGNNFQLVRLETNQGYGGGILAGLKHANADILAWTHSDLQTDPNDVLRALEKYQAEGGENIFMKGVRLNRSLLPKLLSLLMQWTAFFLLGIRVNEINAQPKMFTRDLYDLALQLGPPNDFSLDLFFLCVAHKCGARVVEIPVKFDKRFAGEAKGGGSNFLTIARISHRSVKFILELRRKSWIKNL